MTDEKEIPGKVILSVLAGSRSFGLHTPESDYDTAGIYMASQRELTGLGATKAMVRSICTTEPDSTFHELWKFCNLAVKGNPSVLEILWSPKREAPARAPDQRRVLDGDSGSTRGTHCETENCVA